jgi:hypothetical protein|tara:strand:- start:696 stop:1040 length:345 start_codon:yes stop_codon:yes gene_type:complete
MKITKTQLKQIIKEELSSILGEEEVNELAASPFNPDPNSPAFGTLQNRDALLSQSKCKDVKREYESMIRGFRADANAGHMGTGQSLDYFASRHDQALKAFEKANPDCFPQKQKE